MAVNGWGLASIGFGATFLYGAINNKSPLQVFHAILTGAAPSTALSGAGFTLLDSGTAPGTGATGTQTPGSASTGPGGSYATTTGSYAPIDAAMKSWGFTKAGRAGALGNLQVESSFNPNGPAGDNGTSFGIAQWHLGRHDNLVAYAIQNRLDPTGLPAQLGYMKQELDGSYLAVYGYMRIATDPAAAAQYWSVNYERNTPDSIPDRQDNAVRIFKELK